MSSLELNKAVGSVLFAVLTLVVIGKIGDNLVSTGGGHGGGHGAAGGDHGATASAPVAKKPEPLEPILGMLASADAAAGEKVFAKCKACHTVDKGGKNTIGPNLWGVVGRAPGSHEGFAYSDALKGKTGTPWDYAHLSEFLHKPSAYAKGTKMSFAGISKTSDLANVVAYLRTLADSPAPLPSQADIDAANKAYEAAKAAAAAPAPAAAHGAAKPAAAPAAQTAAATAAPEKPIAELLASADAAKGERSFAKCKACHTVNEGGKNGIGPNLWGIVGRTPGSVAGFSFSDGLKAHNDKPWTVETLSEFLASPKDFAKGTKMSFIGLKKATERADVIAYLKTLSK
jgi:cytochrome c